MPLAKITVSVLEWDFCVVIYMGAGRCRMEVAYENEPYLLKD